MSCEEKSPRPSNDAMIDDLVRDLEQAELQDGSGDESHNVAASKEPPDDFINETALKDAELNLSEEDKESRRQRAAELKARGNAEFKAQQYTESAASYTAALQLCPLACAEERAVLYANRAAAKVQLGRCPQSALDDCNCALQLNAAYARALLRRAKLLEQLNKLDESLQDYQRLLEIDAGNREAVAATIRLPPLINERNEQMKTEMLGKLKDLGNLILKPFGMSTDHFKVENNNGGYSINFNPPKP